MPPSLASLARRCTLGTVQCLASRLARCHNCQTQLPPTLAFPPVRCHSHRSLKRPSHASSQLGRCHSCQTLQLPTLAFLPVQYRSHQSLMRPSHASQVRQCKLGIARCLASLGQQCGMTRLAVSRPVRYRSRRSLMLPSRASVMVSANLVTFNAAAAWERSTARF